MYSIKRYIIIISNIFLYQYERGSQCKNWVWLIIIYITLIFRSKQRRLWVLLGQIRIFIGVNFTAKYDAKNIVITLWFLSIRVIFTPPFVPLVTAFHQSNKGNLDDLESWGFAHQRLTSSRKFLGWSSARWHRKKNKVCLFSNVYRFRSD